jgi:hypothetical protein
MEVLSLYQHNLGNFPPGRSSPVVGARFGGVPALPEQLNMVRYLLQQNGLTPFLATYNVTPGGHLTAPQGTVFIDARSGLRIVYVEDEYIPI